jgi:ubiquitin C-terminal hydrolase
LHFKIRYHQLKMNSNKLLPTKNIGFINTGTICYFNSLLQTLISCPSFNKYCAEHIKEIISPQAESNYNILLLRSFLQNYKSTFNFGTSQECADECFKLLIEHFNAESIFMIEYSQKGICFNCRGISTLPITTNNHILIDNNTTIQEHIYEHNEIVEDYKCPHCKKKNNMLIRKYLNKSSDVIMLLFNKYYKKFSSDIPKKLVFLSASKKKIKYELVSIIYHYGTKNGGHYTATCLRDDIYNFNDLTITKSSFNDNLENAYMAFYHIKQ